jgi:hypothetical protein
VVKDLERKRDQLGLRPLSILDEGAEKEDVVLADADPVRALEPVEQAFLLGVQRAVLSTTEALERPLQGIRQVEVARLVHLDRLGKVEAPFRIVVEFDRFDWHTLLLVREICLS